MLLMGDIRERYAEAPNQITAQAGVLTSVYVTLIVGIGCMSFAARISATLGRTGMNMISRLLGMLLMALSTQYIFDGIRVGVLERVGS